MTNQFVQITPDSTGKKLDTEELTVGVNTVQRERFEIAGSVDVQIASVINTAPAGAEYGLIVRNIPSGSQNTAGDVAHGVTDTGNPHKIGFRALAHGTNPTAVVAGQRTDWLASRAGIPWVIGGHPNIITRRDNFTVAQTDTALVTIATGLKIVVTRISISLDRAATVNVTARVGFGLTVTPTGAGVLISHPGIGAGSNIVEGNGAGILGIGADDQDLRITCTVPTNGSIDVVTSYYTIES